MNNRVAMSIRLEASLPSVHRAKPLERLILFTTPFRFESVISRL